MYSNKLVLKITSNVWENASRDIRELSVVKELGANVLVMAKGERTGITENVKGFSVYRMTTKPLGNTIPKSLNQLVSVFLWASKARKIHPDIISGHDLIPLFIGWLSTCFMRKKNKPKLVYDSHEFTIYAGHKSKLTEFITKYLERFLIKKCVFTIEVNDQIADEVQEIHGLQERPVVVRNIPEKWEIDSEECATMKKDILQKFSKDDKDVILLMYHGAVLPNRGVETLIKLIKESDNLVAMILGNGSEEYLGELHALVKEYNIEDRVIFHKAVPQKELWRYVGAADIGMILAPAISKNHLYSLPNKFFENIQSETPIICPNYPAMASLVSTYNIGLICDPTDINDVKQKVIELYENKKLYQQCKDNVKNAKNELCWEKEKKILVEAYQNYL